MKCIDCQKENPFAFFTYDYDYDFDCDYDWIRLDWYD